MNPEQVRIEESRLRRAHWNRWGPFLSARSWGTVREDYSANGDAWNYFPFEDAVWVFFVKILFFQPPCEC